MLPVPHEANRTPLQMYRESPSQPQPFTQQVLLNERCSWPNTARYFGEHIDGPLALPSEPQHGMNQKVNVTSKFCSVRKRLE